MKPIGYMIVFTIVSLVVHSAFNTPSYSQSTSTPSQEKKVISFEYLDRIVDYEELPQYGLVQPDHYNHKSGTNLVLLALKVTSYLKGNWVSAHGLLGTAMLDVRVTDRIAYKSLFKGLDHRFKLYSTHLEDNGLLLYAEDLRSIITRRERALLQLSMELNSRYIYNDQGNFARNYDPEPNRKSNKKLRQSFLDGVQVYKGFQELNYDDKALRDALGIAYASLVYDEAFDLWSEVSFLGPLQVYSDALSATLDLLKEKRNHSYHFLDQLGWQMQSRGLTVDDQILLPTDEANFTAFLRIVEDDLESIRN